MRSTVSGLALSSGRTAFRLLIITATLLFSSAAALAQANGGFFGFSFGTSKSDIEKKHKITPINSSKYRNAYALSGDPPVMFSEFPDLGYIVHLYFSDNDQLIRVLVEIGTREGDEVEALDAAHTAMLWDAIRTRLKEKYKYVSDSIFAKLLLDNPVTNDDIAKACKRYERNNVVMVTIMGPFINNDAPISARYHYAFCSGKDVYSYFDAPNIPSEINVGFQPNDLDGAFVKMESCSRKFGIGGCSDFYSNYTKPTSQPF